jgi:hypothetical protein
MTWETCRMRRNKRAFDEDMDGSSYRESGSKLLNRRPRESEEMEMEC